MNRSPFSDDKILHETIEAINRGETAFRVSDEHYLWLSSGRSLVTAIVQTVGGEVEGQPTSRINILQRLRELVRKEKLLREATDLLNKVEHTVSIHGKLDANTPLHQAIDYALEVLDPQGNGNGLA